MRTKILFVTILLFITAAWSQENINSTYGFVGFSQPQIDSLNHRLSSFNYSQFEKEFLCWGVGFYSSVGKSVLMGFEWQKSSGKEKTSADGTVEQKLESTSWFVNLGIMALNTGIIRVFPYIGIGDGTMTLTLKDVNLPSFDDIISGDFGETKIKTGGILIKPALGVEVKTSAHFVIGVHAGYVFDPQVGDWKVEDTEIANGPKSGLTSPYVYLTLGLGN